MSWDPDQQLATPPSGAAALRPLSIGELFDRAFSLYFRHALTFAALLFAIMVPIALVQYFMTRDMLDAYMGIIDSAVKHSTTPPDLTKLDTTAAAAAPWTALYYLFILIALPIANAAVVSGVSRAYLGLPVRFRACYSDAFKRWGYVLILSLLWLLIVLFFAFAATFILIILIAVIAGMATVLKTFGVVVGAVLGIALSLAFAALVIMGYMAFACSFIACVLEKTDPIRSFTLGLARVFDRKFFGRSALVAGGLALLAIGFTLAVTVVAALTFWATKSAFLYIAIVQLANVFFITFAFVVVALYYYDIRIRREGFDIQLLADQLASTDTAETRKPPGSP